MPDKVTIMVLKVDLQCWKCYKKVKKVLCKYPEIHDQIYDEKLNTVTIKVVCCCPEKLRDKIRCKGGSTIKSIEIKHPEIPKEPVKLKEPVKKKEPEKPKETEKEEAEKPKKPEKKKEPVRTRYIYVDRPPKPKPKPKPKPEPEPKVLPSKPADPPPGYPPYYPFGVCCLECYEGRVGGPCYHGRGPPRCYDGYYGRPVYDSWGGGGRSYYRCCTDYLREENYSGCTIM